MIIQGNAKGLPLRDRSVQCVVTSPPYWGLRDYGVSGQLGLEPTPELYVEHMVEVFRDVRRVLRDDGTIWVNLGSSYAGSWGNYHPDSPPGKHGQRLSEWAWISNGIICRWRVNVARSRDCWYKVNDYAGQASKAAIQS